MGTIQRAIRVMIVDHQCSDARLDRLIAGARPRMEMVGKARDATEAAALAERTWPDVVMLDLDTGDDQGVAMVPALRRTAPRRILGVTTRREAPTSDAAILRGACGIVQKGDPDAVILKAIEKVHAGEFWLDRLSTARVLSGLARPEAVREPQHAGDLPQLTAREFEIVAQVAAAPGGGNRELAQSLRLGERTLRNHLSRIYDKLGVANRFELYLYAQGRNRISTAEPASPKA